MQRPTVRRSFSPDTVRIFVSGNDDKNSSFTKVTVTVLHFPIRHANVEEPRHTEEDGGRKFGSFDPESYNSARDGVPNHNYRGPYVNELMERNEQILSPLTCLEVFSQYGMLVRVSSRKLSRVKSARLLLPTIQT